LESLALNLAINDKDLALVTICADAQLAISHISQNRSRRHRTASPRG